MKFSSAIIVIASLASGAYASGSLRFRQNLGLVEEEEVQNQVNDESIEEEHRDDHTPEGIMTLPWGVTATTPAALLDWTEPKVTTEEKFQVTQVSPPRWLLQVRPAFHVGR